MSTDAHARKADPATSHDAALAVMATDLEAFVLEVLKAHPAGLTSIEIAERLATPAWSISPRMKPLERKRMIVRIPERRKGVNGRPSTVWAVTSEGADALMFAEVKAPLPRRVGANDDLKALVLQGLEVVEDFLRSNPSSMLRVASNARLNNFLIHAKTLKAKGVL